MAAESEVRLREPQPTADHAVITPASDAPEKGDQRLQAFAMVKEALEIDASIPKLPPAERNQALLRMAVLNNTANQLLTGANRPPPSFGGLEPPNTAASP